MRIFLYINYLTMFLLSFINTAHSITFNTSKLHDSSETNYIKFKSKYSTCSSQSEKIVADFNNDNHQDILSLGGSNNCDNEWPNQDLNLELNMYVSGDYVFHDTNIPYGSRHVNVVDIDNDKDLDFVDYPL